MRRGEVKGGGEGGRRRGRRRGERRGEEKGGGEGGGKGGGEEGREGGREGTLDVIMVHIHTSLQRTEEMANMHHNVSLVCSIHKNVITVMSWDIQHLDYACDVWRLPVP